MRESYPEPVNGICSIEEQLDVLNDLCTWFGTTPDIPVQDFVDAINANPYACHPKICITPDCDREVADEELSPRVVRCSTCIVDYLERLNS